MKIAVSSGKSLKFVGIISSNIDSSVKIYATGRNVATPNSKKQVKTIIIRIDFAVCGVLEKWEICP